jgi:type I restriction enzyme R subunit
MQPNSANFDFLRAREGQLFRLAALGERYFRTDPNTCLIKLRQFAELMAKDVASRIGVLAAADEPFAAVVGALARAGTPAVTVEMFHFLRRHGNDAAHAGLDDFATALTGLKIARQLAVWFMRSYGGQPALSAGPFTPPPAPPDPTAELRVELARLKAEADSQRSAAELATARAEELEQRNRSTEDVLRREAEERQTWQRLAEEAEASAAAVRAALLAQQHHAQQAPAAEIVQLVLQADAAAESIQLDEASTRTLIDQQLRDAGWEADTPNLRHAKGTRPTKGRNLAIAEWPTASGSADYALFAGLKLVGTVEAKRANRNVMSVLPQAERYAEGIKQADANLCEGAPWGAFKAPFAFSTNGRPYLKQLETASGIWRRDLRRPTNPAGALAAWPTPQGLIERLEVAAEASLQAQGFDYGFPIRPYQRRAIEAVEKGLAEDRARMLIGMATGTGKTKL